MILTLIFVWWVFFGLVVLRNDYKKDRAILVGDLVAAILLGWLVGPILLFIELNEKIPIDSFLNYPLFKKK